MFISCWEQLLDGLSCLQRVLETAAPDLVGAGTVMRLFWTLGWEQPIASAQGRETARAAGKQPREERQQSSFWLFQSSWKDQHQILA